MHESQVELMLEKDILVTTDCWFTAPDGESYKAVYGKLIAIYTDEQALGVKTNSKSTNWYAQVGNMLLAGCQIHYAINCQDKYVNFGDTSCESTHEGKCVKSTQKSKIYNANFEEE